MDKKQELALQETYEKLLLLSNSEKVSLPERLTCALTAGCIKPGLSMESCEVIDNVAFNIMQGQQIINRYKL